MVRSKDVSRVIQGATLVMEKLVKEQSPNLALHTHRLQEAANGIYSFVPILTQALKATDRFPLTSANLSLATKEQTSVTDSENPTLDPTTPPPPQVHGNHSVLKPATINVVVSAAPGETLPPFDYEKDLKIPKDIKKIEAVSRKETITMEQIRNQTLNINTEVAASRMVTVSNQEALKEGNAAHISFSQNVAVAGAPPVQTSVSTASVEEDVSRKSIPQMDRFAQQHAAASRPPPAASPKVHKELTERSVPATPLSRVLGFGSLAARLAMGTVAETIRQTVSPRAPQFTKEGKPKPYSAVLSDANAERLAETLCKMRGAALKIGQMLSIQDEGLMPEALSKALERVRQGANTMPQSQLGPQMTSSLGENWMDKFQEFEDHPIAAASIGQVHRAVLKDGRVVAMKVQYPGVAKSIDSDLNNLKTLITVLNIFPPGLFIDEIIQVGREELTRECNYEFEANNQERFKELIKSDRYLNEHIVVPDVIREISSREVLSSEFVNGVSVDQVANMPQEVRNHVARLVLRVTIKELFDWRFMQTDPNWGNFLYDEEEKKLAFIDFGACREFDKDFVDTYLKLVWSAANQEEDKILAYSKHLGFLTGDESEQMIAAHIKSGLVVGEPFVSKGDFDFYESNMTLRITKYGDTFMKHRLTPPPREAYTLHRKLAGAFLLCIKLKAVIPCRDILEQCFKEYDWVPKKKEK